ncbi:Glycosyl transferase family 2 [Klenkia brasiliensis]|uniref:Glycosyl transferase family 2 n=2 Tax=Klenkia brasiliensis TaxID=333142 RepID=A0A1G7LGV5_9ACTN|nr:Glycosyl transferase family 2 [Klenkia brasiliensis]
MDTPLVTVLVPTWNGAVHLRATLRSILTQSYKNLQVVVGDDASTDDTPSILAAVAEADPRVEVVTHPVNGGQFVNQLALLERVRGEFVKFVMHDDVLATDHVRVLVRGLQAHPEARMAFSRRLHVDASGKEIPGSAERPLADRSGLLDGSDLVVRCLRAGANLVGEPTTVLMRSADLAAATEDLGFLDGETLWTLTDFTMWLRLLARGPAFYSPDALSRFRHHATQDSADARLISRGLLDWPRVVDWAHRSGLLADPGDRRAAYAQVLGRCAAWLIGPAGADLGGPAARAALLCLVGMHEVDAGVVGGDPDVPLALRAGAAPVGALLGTSVPAHVDSGLELVS